MRQHFKNRRRFGRGATIFERPAAQFSPNGSGTDWKVATAHVDVSVFASKVRRELYAASWTWRAPPPRVANSPRCYSTEYVATATIAAASPPAQVSQSCRSASGNPRTKILYTSRSMPTFPLPTGAIPADLPQRLRLQLASSASKPPDGEGWLHEVKYDGHRLAAIVAGGTIKLLSRNIRDRTKLFAEPFQSLAAAGLPALVLDGEIAVPDDRGVTHIDMLNAAISEQHPERFAYFAFDLLHLDGHDLQRCPLEDRKALLKDVIGAAGCERLLYVDHVVGQGPALFDVVRQAGAEGIVSKRRDGRLPRQRAAGLGKDQGQRDRPVRGDRL